MDVKRLYEDARGLSETTRFAKAMRYFTGQRDPGRGIGIITAENPQARELSPEENRRRMKQLKQRLEEMGLNYTQQWGRYFDITENPVLVYDVDVNQLVRLGKEFDQASFIWGVRELDGTMSFALVEGDDITNIRHKVRTGPEAQSREDMVSGFYQKIKQEGGERPAMLFRKYFIPFFAEGPGDEDKDIQTPLEER